MTTKSQVSVDDGARQSESVSAMPQDKVGGAFAAVIGELESIRDKYREERDRRVRPEGEAQYFGATGDFAGYMDNDPYVAEELQRDAVVLDTPVLIIGGGWAGMIAGARLRDAGVEFKIIDDASDFGGTWYWNRYPGAQCDVDSYCYFPLLEETGYVPTNKYSYAPELYEHARRIGTHFGLYERALFQTRVKSIRWDGEIKRWHVETSREDAITAQFVMLAPGPTSRGKLPGIPGIDTFKGHTFHTIRWDYEYTGGDSFGNLHKLADKRVAIIGTGATAIQCVPYLGQSAKELLVIQRTPSSVGVRANRPTDPDWVASLAPGWQRERQKNFDDLYVGANTDIDMIDDGLSAVFRKITPRNGASEEERNLNAEIEDMKLMNEVRQHISEIVVDPKTAEALKPWYRVMCKRPCFNDEYLQTFNLPNVRLIDTSGSRGVERITETGLVVDGVEHPVDCIIFATGFEQSGNWSRRLGDMTIFGEDGLSLFDHWSSGMRTFFGTMIHGFPNFFYSGPGQTGASFNYTTMADAPAALMAHVVRSAMDQGFEAVQPAEQAEQKFVSLVRANSTNNADYQQSCTPGYYNAEGKKEQVYKYDVYAPGQNKFREMIDGWIDRGNLDGLQKN